MRADHPQEQLLFCIEGSIPQELRSRMRDALTELAESGQWVIGPPLFVDEVEEPENPEIDDPLRTLGGLFRIYAARPPWELPKEIDRAHLREVEAIVAAMERFSRGNDVVLAFELDGTSVGWIQSGKANETLVSGLLDPWREAVR